VQNVVEEIKAKIQEKILGSDISVSTYPVDIDENPDEDIYRTVKTIVNFYPECANIHNIHVYESAGKKRIAAHIELKDNISLKESHKLSHKIESEIEGALKDISSVSISFECANQKAKADEMTDEELKEIKEKIRGLVSRVDEKLDCHDIEIYRNGKAMSAFLHCASAEDYTVDKLKTLSNDIKLELKRNIENLESVHIHFEPFEED
jgi:divalent metal cation (Fe/Co/Zn/Cd) transporter